MATPSFKELLDRTAATLREDGNVLSAMAGLFFFLPLLIAFWLTLDSLLAGADSGVTEHQLAEAMGQRVWVFLPVAIAMFVGQLGITAFLLDPEKPTVGGALLKGLKLLLPYLAVMLPVQLGVQLVGVFAALLGVFGQLLLMALAVFVSMRLFLLMPILGAAAAGRRPIASARRSWDLTGGDFWKPYLLFLVGVFGATMLGFVGVTLIALPASIIFGPDGQTAATAFLGALLLAALSLYSLLFSVSAWRALAERA